MTVTLRPVPESLRIPPAPREITRAAYRRPLDADSARLAAFVEFRSGVSRRRPRDDAELSVCDLMGESE